MRIAGCGKAHGGAPVAPVDGEGHCQLPSRPAGQVGEGTVAGIGGSDIDPRRPAAGRVAWSRGGGDGTSHRRCCFHQAAAGCRRRCIADYPGPDGLDMHGHHRSVAATLEQPATLTRAARGCCNGAIGVVVGQEQAGGPWSAHSPAMARRQRIRSRAIWLRRWTMPGCQPCGRLNTSTSFCGKAGPMRCSSSCAGRSTRSFARVPVRPTPKGSPSALHSWPRKRGGAVTNSRR